ncbi:MAG: glutamate-cysteine ligase family protein [Gemmatimonadota bacterium]|jgi:CBS domain-containing protein
MSETSAPDRNPDAFRSFTKALLADLQALEEVLARGLIETGVRRIGAEQEAFLVDRSFHPAPVAPEVIDRLDDPAFTHELGRFNLEMNLSPVSLAGPSLRTLQEEIERLLEKAREAAAEEGADVLLAGILPTIAKSDLSLENITPKPRYFALNDALNRMRGGTPYDLKVVGWDEIHVQHDSVMLEACNASCQFHLQVSADEFAPFYNAAQAVLAPVLAAAANSPLLFGKRLWAETRIALFQQSLDTRDTSVHQREMLPRVRFGEHWVDGSVVELFQEDIARFRVLLAGEIEEDPLSTLQEGGIPSLKALQFFNGTVYRWNRPCYGVMNGKPHLRIESRVLPSGPTVRDEVANGAFWTGLVLAAPEEIGDVTDRMDFDEARSNFIAAARLGLNAGFEWFDGEAVDARTLILQRLLPMAERGLKGAGVDHGDADTYLGVIRDRVESGQNGTVWALRSVANLKGKGTRSERLAAIAANALRQQKEGRPVHEWDPADLTEAGGWQQTFVRVGQYMKTTLFTVGEDELVEMAAFLMDRKKIRHVPVEDTQHHLVGLLSYREILRMMAESPGKGIPQDVQVRDVMDPDPICVEPDTPTVDAIELMREKQISCLPVLKDGRLVGLVSERDFLPIAYELLKEKLGQE